MRSASARVAGHSTPAAPSASTSSGHEVERLGRTAELARYLLGGHAAGQELAGAAVAAARGQHRAHEVTDAGEADERLGAATLGEGELEALGEHAPGGGAGGVVARRGGHGGGERGGVLGARAQLGADHVGGLLDVEPRALEDLGELRTQIVVVRGEDHGRAALDRLGCVRRAAQEGHGPSRHARGHVRGGTRGERLDQALGQHEHRAAVADASAESGHDLGKLTRGHGQHHEVDPAELDLRDRRDPQLRRQLDPGQVVGVGALLADALGLIRTAAPELNVKAGPRQQGREGGAHRPGADDGRGAQRRQAAEPLPLELDARPDPLADLGRETLRRLVHAGEGERTPAAHADL